MFVGLKHGADGEFDKRRRGLFDVATEHVGHGLAFGELDQVADAGGEHGSVADVEASRIDGAPVNRTAV